MADGADGPDGSPEPTPSVETEPTSRRIPRWLVQAAQIFGLCGFAVAQPVFDLLGNNATFFVAHDAGAGTIIFFTLVLLFVPPAIVFGVVAIARAISEQVGHWAMTVVVGGLVALTIVPIIDRSQGLSTKVFLALFVVVGAAAGFLYHRFTAAQTFTTYLSPMPLLFAFVFLFASPVNTLISGGDTAAAAEVSGGRNTPVVMLILDELPLGGLLNSKGELDSVRFPGFAKLASVSTWYPNATTVAAYTNQATPALISGTLHGANELPVAATIPRSLFTMLGGTHPLSVQETVTRMCPKNLCNSANYSTGDSGSLSKDAAIVYLHTVLPNGLAERFGLPAIDSGWGGFGDNVGTTGGNQPVSAREWAAQIRGDGNRDNAARFRRFARSIDGSPKLSYLHLNMPHVPWRYLPDGTQYNGGELMPGTPDFSHWGNDKDATDVGRQRFMLQLKWADLLVGRLVDRLRHSGVLDRAMVVVASDHGGSFEPGHHRRALPLDDINKDEVLPVPLFIKYPGETAGKVDAKHVQTIDVLPTIADALSLNLPKDWKFDGQSILKPRRGAEHQIAFAADKSLVDVPDGIQPAVMARQMEGVFGKSGGPHDLYAFGPYRSLVGQPAAPLEGAPAGGSVSLKFPGFYSAVDTKSGVLPAMYQGTVSNVSPDAWVAVSLNGTIAGDGPVIVTDTLNVLLDPQYFKDGQNAVKVYLIGADGRSLHELRGA